MPFILRATFKDETRNINFADDGGWPMYREVQAKLRSTFGLPSTTVLYLWHVYFSPTDGVGECKFKRHVCSAEEYNDAASILMSTKTFPRPTLIFQVLLNTDPRLSTAQKFHQSVTYTNSRSALTSARQTAADAVTRCAVVVTALKSKGRACAPDDGVGQRFWQERLSEKSGELTTHVEKLRQVEEEIKALESGATNHKSAVDKETQRNKESKAEVMAFLTSWNKRVANGEVEDVALLANAVAERALVEEVVSPSPGSSASSRAKKLSATNAPAVKVEQLINFADPADLPLPETLTSPPTAAPARHRSQQSSPRGSDDVRVQAFPSLESILNAATHPSRVNPAVGTPPLPSVGRSYSQMANQIRAVAVPAVEATGEMVSTEIKSILEGFLVNLSGQLDAFEGGLKAQYSRGRQTVDSNLKKVDEAVERATIPHLAKGAKKTKESEVKVEHTSPDIGAETAGMPGAFPSGPAVTVKLERTPDDDGLAALKKSLTHVYKICDSCGSKPAGVCYKCDHCADFDLCSECLPRLQTSFHAKDHTFTAIFHAAISGRLSAIKPKGKSASAPTAPTKVQTHSATCDGCDNRIKGERYKCLDCPDWDCCSSCFESVDEIHSQHSFVRITRREDYIPGRGASRRVPHPRVVCDNCREGIAGPRFKCMHPNCPDFDLCDACESAPTRTHPIDHPMLKMRIPGRVQSHSFFEGGSTDAQGVPAPSQPRQPQGGRQDYPGRHGPWRDYAAAWEIPNNEEGRSSGPHFHGHHGHRGHPGFGRLGRAGHGPHGPTFDHPFNPTRCGPGAYPAGPRAEVRGMDGGFFGRHPRHCRPGPRGQSDNFSCPSAMPQFAGPFGPKESEVTGCGMSMGSEPEKTAQSLEKAPAYTVEEELAPLVELAITSVSAAPVTVGQPEAPKETLETAVTSLADITIPDGFPLPPNAQFVKIWELKNTGQTVISRDCFLRFVGGENFGLDLQSRITPLNHDVKPGELFNVSVSLRAPSAVADSYIGYWRLAGPSGEDFGHRLWVEIKVVEADLESSLSSSSVIMPNVGTPSKAMTVADEAEDEPSLFVSMSEAADKAPLAEEQHVVATRAPATQADEALFSPMSDARTLDEISTTSWDDSDEEVMRLPHGSAAARTPDEEAYSDEDFELLENDTDEE